MNTCSCAPPAKRSSFLKVSLWSADGFHHRVISVNYLNIKISDLRSEPFLHATSSQKGQWLELCAHCCTQTNGGRILNCKNWSPSTWIKITGTETPESPCTLWHWHKADLIVEFYPIQQEMVFLNRRGSAREANRIRWGKNMGLQLEPE